MQIKVRGCPSTTLPFVIAGSLALLYRFVFAGQDLGLGEIPIMTGGEFAAAFASVLGVWQWREYNAKKQERTDAE
jgi:hypothetical protein